MSNLPNTRVGRPSSGSTHPDGHSTHSKRRNSDSHRKNLVSKFASALSLILLNLFVEITICYCTRLKVFHLMKRVSQTRLTHRFPLAIQYQSRKHSCRCSRWTSRSSSKSWNKNQLKLSSHIVTTSDFPELERLKKAILQNIHFKKQIRDSTIIRKRSRPDKRTNRFPAKIALSFSTECRRMTQERFVESSMKKRTC